MRAQQPSKLRRAGYTLVEVLTVCAIIGILTAIAAPSTVQAVKKARRTKCANNLHQIGIAFGSFAHDHGDRYPQQVSVAEGGSREQNLEAPVLNGQYILSPLAFYAASDALRSPQVMICPGTKLWVSSFSSLNLTNLCYALNLHAQPGSSTTVLAADGHLLGDWYPLNQNRVDRNQNQILFMNSRHESMGNVLFGDGHVELQRSVKNPPAQLAAAAQAVKSLAPKRETASQPRLPNERERQEAFQAANPGGRSGDFGTDPVVSVAALRVKADGDLALLSRAPRYPVAQPSAAPLALASVMTDENPSMPSVISPAETMLRRSLLWLWLLLALVGATLVWRHFHREKQRQLARAERWQAYALEQEQARARRLEARPGRV